jgi:Na+/melibiose symporter-like transporter
MTLLLLISKDSQILLYIGLSIVYIFIFVFWLFMLIDAIRNRNTQGAVWIIILAVAGFIGSVIYYFAVRRKRKRKVPAEPDLQDGGAYYLGGTTKDDVIKY